MDTLWLVSICLILFVIVIFILTRKSKPEAEALDTGASTSTPAQAYSSYGGKRLECSEEEMDRLMQRLNNVLYKAPSEPPKVAAHAGAEDACHRRREAERSSSGREGLEPAHSQAAHPPSHLKVQERPTQPAAVENIMDEIEQAVQETVESELYMRRRQHQAGPMGRREGQ